MAADLFEEPDLLDDNEEIAEILVAEIDDPDRVVVGNQRIEERHLTGGVVDIHDGGTVRNEVRQLRAFLGKIECRNGPIVKLVKLDQQPGKERLSDAPPRGADDV